MARGASIASFKAKRGSGNVFADLGMDNPELELAKAKLVSGISREMTAKGLTIESAAQSLGMPAGELDGLLRGGFGEYEVDRLEGLLGRLASV